MTSHKFVTYNRLQALNDKSDRMYVEKKDEKWQCFEIICVFNPTKYIQITGRDCFISLRMQMSDWDWTFIPFNSKQWRVEVPINHVFQCAKAAQYSQFYWTIIALDALCNKEKNDLRLYHRLQVRYEALHCNCHSIQSSKSKLLAQSSNAFCWCS